jgi:hypothetical protein
MSLLPFLFSEAFQVLEIVTILFPVYVKVTAQDRTSTEHVGNFFPGIFFHDATAFVMRVE